MIKKGLLITILMLAISACAGTMQIAEEDSSTSTQTTSVAKPSH